MTEKPLHVRVAEALGWKAWLEKRGDYEMALAVAPGGKEPWTSTRKEYQRPERYRAVSLYEAEKRGYYGATLPRYDTSWESTGPLIEKYGMSVQPSSEPGRWWAEDIKVGTYDEPFGRVGATPLLAVCNLILALSEAGKLRSDFR